MSNIEIIGFGFSLLIGLSLGLVGGGGSILTLPVLVYMLGINPILGSAYSLFIVGTTSLVGSFNYMKKGLVDFKTAIQFAIPSLIAVFLSRKYLLPAIPENLFSIGTLEIDRGMFIMLIFGIIMLFASYLLIAEKAPEQSEKVNKNGLLLIIVEGIAVGVLTGLVGAGGGFLIIPALVILVGLPMKTAVGTSLLIVAAKSLIGFLGDVVNQDIDWTFLVTFTSISIVGIFIGAYISRFIADKKLQKYFGWFVLLMAIAIFYKELY